MSIYSIRQELMHLEKEAKNSEFWKSRYEELRQKTKETLNALNELVGENISQVRKWHRHDYKGMADKLFCALANDNTLSITQMQFSRYLGDINQTSASIIGRELEKLDGIGVKKDGTKKFYYYTGIKKQHGEIEIGGAKIGKVSFMG